MERTQVGSAAKWEDLVGYSRAVRVGPFIYVTGTTAFGPDGETVGVGDPYAQTAQAIRNVEAALVSLGASLADVVRTRMFVVNIDDWEQIGRAQAEFFGDIRPATTMVEVRRLIAPDLLVEIEADAVITSGTQGCYPPVDVASGRNG